jgi:TonB family protein
MLTRLATAVLLFLPTAVHAAAEVRQPTGRWAADFSDRQCLARRSFGTADSPLDVYLRMPVLSGVVQVTVARKGTARHPERLVARVQADGQPEFRTTALVTSIPGGKLRWHLVNLPPTEVAGLRNARTLRVRTEGINETFALPGLPMILSKLDACVARLQATWHATPEGAPETVQEPAEGDLQSVFRSSDYPDSAAYLARSGSATFVVLIDESGRVVDCNVVESSDTPSLDGQTCTIMRERARFKPAVGFDGKPAKYALIQRIIWRVE